MKKFLLVISIGLICSVSLFSQSFGMDLIRNSDLSVEVPFGLNEGQLRNYSKAETGVEVKLATTLGKINSKNISLGISTNFFYDSYVFKRDEIQSFYIRGLTEGLWGDFCLPHGFGLRGEIYGGFAVTKIKAESIYESKIDENYNCCIFGTSAIVRKKLFKAGTAEVYGNCGVNFRLLVEKKYTNFNTDIMAGFTVKAGSK